MERNYENLKIKKIEIYKLYNMYNYEIKFNEDITFLHGKNGCGKTTILNIITYIITGKIYKLFSYEFDKIILTYKRTRKKEEIIFNKISENNISINFENEHIEICQIMDEIALVRRTRELREDNENERIYFEQYPILQKIKDLFDFAYIPLNRNDLMDRDRSILYRRYRYRRMFRENSEEPICNIAYIILDNYARIKSEISRLGKELQINIVKSMYQYNINDYIQKPEKRISIKKDIENFKKANLYDEQLGGLINDFYNKLTSGAGENNEQKLDYVINVSKLAQLNKIQEVFDDYDKKVEKLNEPISKLEKIVNRFFEDSAERKKLVISENEIFFITEHDERKVELYNLSSGEKQIFILFTYLIFDVASKDNPIFIIDEPELSLHLLWQKNFVTSVLETNPKMQLILATHSPEIIDKYRDKTYKVELNIN